MCNQIFILFTYGEMWDLMNASLKALLNEQYKLVAELREENKKLKEDVDFYYKSAKQFREQVEKWEKDFLEWSIVECKDFSKEGESYLELDL